MADGPDPGDRPPTPDGPAPETRDDEAGYAGPREMAHAAGTALMNVGWVGALFALVLAGLGVLVTVEEAAGPRQTRSEDILILGVILAGIGLASAVALTITAVGGARMRRCRNRGLALTAASLAGASFVLLGLCAVLVMPFGIWALAVLARPDVKREFELADRARRRAARAAGDENP